MGEECKKAEALAHPGLFAERKNMMQEVILSSIHRIQRRSDGLWKHTETAERKNAGNGHLECKVSEVCWCEEHFARLTRRGLQYAAKRTYLHCKTSFSGSKRKTGVFTAHLCAETFFYTILTQMFDINNKFALISFDLADNKQKTLLW